MTKILVIGAMVLGLFIPLAMVGSLVEERQERRASVVSQMGRIWGLPQTIGGPYLETARNRPAVQPARVNVSGRLDAEVRSKGIYRIPFYSVKNLKMVGEFPPTYGSKKPVFFLEVADKKAVEVVSFVVDGKPLRFRDRGSDPQRLIMRLPEPARRFTLKLKVQGIEKLHFKPVGNYTVDLKSNWPDPNFSGAYLPATREISDEGFVAQWSVRNLMTSPVQLNVPVTPPQVDLVHRGDWETQAKPAADDFSSAFGVNLFLPVDIYQQATRSVKYGILFIGLTFLAFFLFEVLAELRIHPLQYLLVGSALCIFYLLLLSFSEQFGFFISYLGGAFATITLITMYSSSVLGQGRRALILGFFLSVLYGFLFTLLQMEQYSLLLGSVAIFGILAAVMYLTRNIDWYDLPVRAPDTAAAK